MPEISVITPVYNGSKFLEDLIQNIKLQKNINLEHIVIDDGSSDNGQTRDILKKYQHLKWWSRQNKGQYPTLNEGIQAAVGEWILIISADDLMASDIALNDLLKCAKDNIKVDAVIGKTILIDEESKIINSYGRPNELSPTWINYYYLLIQHCSMIVSRKFIFDNNLFFDEGLKYTGDWDWIIRIIKKGNIKFLDKDISKYRLHSFQTRSIISKAQLNNEDIVILKRYNSSIFLRKIIVNFYRVKKILYIFMLHGPVEAVKTGYDWIVKS